MIDHAVNHMNFIIMHVWPYYTTVTIHEYIIQILYITQFSLATSALYKATKAYSLFMHGMR